MEKQPVLKIENLSISFGDNQVINNISYHLNKNENTRHCWRIWFGKISV